MSRAYRLNSASRLVVVGFVLSILTAWIVADAKTRPLILNTVIFAGGASLLSLPIGLVTAIHLDRSRGGSRQVALWAVAIMLFLPGYLHVAGWEAGFGMQGWFCRWWYPTEPFALLADWRGALWVQSIINVPWMTLILSIGLATIPDEQENLARLDGNELAVLRHVTFPQLRPAIVAAVLWCFVTAAGEITVTDVYRVRTFAEEIYMGFAMGDDLESAPKRNLPGALLIAGVAASALLACRQVTRSLTSVTFARRVPPESARPAGWLQGAVGCTLLGLVSVPIASLVYQAGFDVIARGDERIRVWSAGKVVSMLVDFPTRFGTEFAWSFVLGQIVSITAVGVAVLTAILGLSRTWLRVGGWSVALASLATPGIITALAVGRIVNQPNSDGLFYLYDRTLFVPWLTLSLKLFPYAFFVATWVISRMSWRPIESTRLDSNSRLAQFRYGWLPQLWHPIAWLWLLTLSMSVADLSATILALPPGVTTVAIRIFNLVHYGVGDQLAALCLGTTGLFVFFSLTITSLLPSTLASRRRQSDVMRTGDIHSG